MGSNGLTSARHDVFSKYLAEKYPESYDKAVPEELVYSGNLKLTDAVEGSPLDAGKLVLSPTRTYAPVVKNCWMLFVRKFMVWFTAQVVHKLKYCISLETIVA